MSITPQSFFSLVASHGCNQSKRRFLSQSCALPIIVERLEFRTLPSTITVNSIGDNIADDDELTLREAIIESNNNGVADTICFDIPGAGPTFVIQVGSALPALTEGNTTIDGTTQAATNPGSANPAGLEIVIDGRLAGAGVNGLELASNNNSIIGLNVKRFQFSIAGGVIGGNGIKITGDNNIVQSNYLGTDETGLLADGNGYGGVLLNGGAADNMIGGSGAGEGNLISGNDNFGIQLLGPGVVNNKVQGNLVGVDATGALALANGNDGIHIAVASSDMGDLNNLIGGAAPGAGNVISGNKANGILLNLNANGNTIQGNRIGTNASGTARLGNTGDGIHVSDSHNNDIIDNLVSGNLSHGVKLTNKSTGNDIQGNDLGTDAAGKAAIANSGSGIQFIGGASNNTIGGSGIGEGNLISGNLQRGIDLDGGDVTGNLILGNRIGIDATESADLGNTLHGIRLNGASNNTIGGASAGEGNVISGNNSHGIFLAAKAQGNAILGNEIGTSVLIRNSGSGIHVSTASNNLIGGTGSGEGNVIAFNTSNGVTVRDTPTPSGNSIRGNSIHSNLGLGIDLVGGLVVGVTSNDAGDADAGPNGLQNFPLLTKAVAAGPAGTVVQGTFDGVSSQTFQIDFYANNSVDPSGYGEGERYLGSTTVLTDGGGHAAFHMLLNGLSSAGEFVTVTATDAAGNTSEFGANVTVLPNVQAVQIEVKPASDPATINLSSQGVIAVSIITTDEFDAAAVDVGSVMFAGAQAVHSALEDVDGDGDLDRVLHFRIEDTNLREIYEQLLADDLNGDGVLDSNRQTVEVSLTGETTEGQMIEGVDTLDLFFTGKGLRELLEELEALGMI